MLSAVLYSCSFKTSKANVFIYVPCFPIYTYFIVFELVVKSSAVLLEEQRSETSCKRNITTTTLLYQLRLGLWTFTNELHKKIDIIIIKQNENTTKTSQLANLFSGNEDYATEQGHILKQNSSLARNITSTNSFDWCFLKLEDNQRALLFCGIYWRGT